MKILFPHEELIHENYPHITPSLHPIPQSKKKNRKVSAHFPITMTMCKHWSKLVSCSPSRGDCGEVSSLQSHSF